MYLAPYHNRNCSFHQIDTSHWPCANDVTDLFGSEAVFASELAIKWSVKSGSRHDDRRMLVTLERFLG